MSSTQTPVSSRRYPSLSSFYQADARRLESREEDVGLWWREGVDGPLHRAAWVADTGELYLVRLGPVEDGGGQVEILAVADHDDLQLRLAGWRDACGAPDSLSWLRDHAARLGQRVRAAHTRMVAVAGTLVAFASALAISGELA
jgi:hypothetical protein